jgi:hypothetical protein
VAVFAATAAAAAVLSVAAVRVIDAGRDAGRETAPVVRSVSMTGGDGNTVGRVTVSGRSTAAVVVNVDYAIADGTYALELRRTTGAARRIGTLSVMGGRGEWRGTAALSPHRKLTLAMLDAAGAVVCEATLPAV